MRRRWIVAVAIALGVASWVALPEPTDPGGTDRSSPAPSVDDAGAPEEPRSRRSPAEDSRAPHAAALTVVVRSLDDRLVAGAAVTVERLGRDAETASAPEPVHTGADGRAAVAGLTTGWWGLTVASPEFVRAEVRVPWVEGDPSREVVVRLEAAHTVRVSVRDAEGEPAPGVDVRLSAPPSPRGAPWVRRWLATTDAKGSCEVGGLPAGDLFAACRGGRDDDQIVARIPDVLHVELVAPQAPASLEATLEIRVLDHEAEPVRGADVRFFQGRSPTLRTLTADGKTGEDGVCRVTAVADFNAVVEHIEVRSAGYATRRIATSLVQVAAGGHRRFDDARLRPAARLEGVVRGPEGPVAGADVTVWVASSGPFGKMEAERAETDADGRYAVSGLAAGKVVVIPDGYGLDPVGADPSGNVTGSFQPDADELDGYPQWAVVTLVEGETATRDLELVRTGPAAPLRATFSGIVLDEAGKPVPWADVWASGSANHVWIYRAGEALAGADGRFTLTAEAAEGFHLWASAPGLAAADSVDVPMTESGARSGVEIRLKARPVLRGVVRSKLGLDVAGATVHLGSQRHQKFDVLTTRWVGSDTRVLEDGTFALPLPGREGGSFDTPGEGLIVCVTAPGHAPKLSLPLTVKEVKGGKRVELELDAGAAITGRVLDDVDGPVADAAVFLVSPSVWPDVQHWPPEHGPLWDAQLVTRTAADGTFRIGHLVPTRYAVRVQAPGTAAARGEVTAPGEILLRARGQLEIAGRVATESGAAAAAYIRILPTEAGQGGELDASTEEDGTFRIESVPAGLWRMEVDFVEDESLMPVVLPSVRAGTTNVRIPAAQGLRIEGTLLGADGRPLDEAVLISHRLSGGLAQYRTRETDAEGRFVLPGLMAGPHDVELEGMGLRWSIAAGAKVALRVPGTETIRATAKVPEGAGWVTLAARPVAPSAGPAVEHRVLVEDGEPFVLGHLAPGRYDVRVVLEPGEWGDKPFPCRTRAGTTLETGVDGAMLTIVYRDR